MVLKTTFTAAVATLLVSACGPVADDTVPPPPPAEASGQAALDQEASEAHSEVVPAQSESDNTTSEMTAEIDWASAREDFASRPRDDEPTFSIAAAGETPPPVPVLLPSGGNVGVASGAGPRFKQTPDGYYAVYKRENYDVIVNGTNEFIGTRAAGPRDEAMKFTATAAGAQVSLSRYGADYLVEFECYEIDPDTGTCIEEAEAMGVAESLVIRGTR